MGYIKLSQPTKSWDICYVVTFKYGHLTEAGQYRQGHQDQKAPSHPLTACCFREIAISLIHHHCPSGLNIFNKPSEFCNIGVYCSFLINFTTAAAAPANGAISIAFARLLPSAI